jgi:parvulin-like peptidyl-prolyl isomerase
VKRPLACLVAALVASVTVSACGVAGDPDAATVDSTSISRSQFDDELETIADNEELASALQSQGLELVPSPGSVSPAISAGWMTARVNQVLVDRLFEERDLTVTAENREAAQAAAEQLFVSPEVFAAFPKDFRDTVLRRQERIEAVRASVPSDDAALEQFFESTRDQFCPSGTVVAHILVPNREEADAIVAELAQGGDFAALARERSSDQGSAETGGLVACTDSEQFGQLVEPFRLAVAATPVGTVSPPVETEFGFHVIKVSPWDFETARPVIEQAYEQQGAGGPYAELLNRRLNRAKVWVDPRYGRVRRDERGVVIVPTPPPDPPERPTPSTTQPGLGQTPIPAPTPTPTPTP